MKSLLSGGGRKEVRMNPLRAKVQEMTDMKRRQKPKSEFSFYVNDAVEHLGRKRRQKKEVSNLLYYIFYVVAFLIATFYILGKGERIFYLQDSMDDILFREEFLAKDSHIKKTFYDVGEMEELWQWIEGPFAKALFVEEWYNGQSIPVDERGYVLRYNRVVGSVRFRQVMVDPDSYCTIPHVFDQFNSSCYGAWSSQNEYKDSFGPNDMWKYKSAAELRILSFWGRYQSYGGGGYVVEPPVTSLADFQASVKEMKDGLFLNKKSRALFINFSTYNANMNRFAVVTALFEFPPAGSVIVSQTMRFIQLGESKIMEADIKIYVAYFVWAVLLVFFLQDFVRDTIEQGKRGGAIAFMLSWWSFVEIVHFVCCFAWIFFRIKVYLYNSGKEVADIDLKNETDNFVDLEYIGFQMQQEINVISFMQLLTFFKLFKYMRVNPRLELLWLTLKKAGTDLFVFTIIFVVMLAAFALMGHFLFGYYIFDFRTPTQAIFACLQLLLGDVQFQDLYASNRILGPVFCFSFIVLNIFVLLNVFIAILNDAYIVAKGEAEQSQDLVHQIRHGFLRKVKKVSKTVLCKKDPKNEKKVSDKKLLKILQSSGKDIVSSAETRDLVGVDADAQLSRIVARVAKRKDHLLGQEINAMKRTDSSGSLSDKGTPSSYVQRLAVLEKKIDSLINYITAPGAPGAQPVAQPGSPMASSMPTPPVPRNSL